jgi:PAS domain S-box-containing protein
MRPDFFVAQMDYVYFFYGASFVALGAVCFSVLRRSSSGKKLFWMWMGLFGFIHGLSEWLEMAAFSLGDSALFKMTRFAVMLISFVCMMEFGRRGIFALWGRRIPPVVYVPLLLLASCGAWAGWNGLEAGVRYCFVLVGCVGAACVIASYKGSEGSPLNKFSLFFLKVAAGVLLLYGCAAGFIVSKASFFPANVFNTATFVASTHLPIQLVRGILALIMATSISLYAVYQSLSVFLAHDPARQRRFITVSFFSILFVLALFVSGWVIVDNHGRRVAQEEKSARYLKSKIFVQFVHMMIGKLDALQALADNREIRDLLSKGFTTAALGLVNEKIDRYQNALEVDVCYLMDATGLTVASSNRDSAKSFVGKNYAFRPYFQEALKGGRGIYLAKGVTSNERGIYVSYPVMSATDTRVVGVAVAKATMDYLGKFFSTYEHVFLVSPEGVIFVSSRPEWVFKSIKEITPFDTERMRATKQFGEGPWENVGFENKDDDAGTVSFLGKPFYFVSDGIQELPGWKVYLMSDSSEVLAARFMLIMILLGFFLFVAIITLFIFRISLDALYLSASEALHEALVESSPDGIYLCDKESRCVSINKNGLFLMGWKRADVIGKHFGDLWPKEYQEKIAAAIKGVLGGEQRNFEARMPKADGSVVISSVTLAPIFEASLKNEIGHFICIARDITEERRSRERLLESSKMATVGALATGVSHEFNNVLEIILGNAESAYLFKDSEDVKKTLKIIMDSARRAAGIIKSMLDFHGSQAGARETADITQILKQNLFLLGKILEADGIAVATFFEEVPRIYCNPGQLSQAFVNIVMNARDAMRGLDGKKLTVRVAYLKESAEVVISFQDTGMGIKEELKSKLFGPFVTTKGILGGGDNRLPGIGLGLFIAYGIIKRHSGNIIVESEEGKGAKFTVFLPVFPGEEDA